MRGLVCKSKQCNEARASIFINDKSGVYFY